MIRALKLFAKKTFPATYDKAHKIKFGILYAWIYLRQIILLRFFRSILKKIIKKIYIFSSYSIGDIIMLSPIAQELKKIFRKAEIIFINNGGPDTASEVVKRIPFFDDAVKTECHLAIRSLIKRFVKKDDLLLAIDYKKDFYRKKNVSYFASLYSSIGIKCPFLNIDLKYNLTDDEKSYALDFKKKVGDYIVFASSASNYPEKKKWPKEHWQGLIDLQGLPVVLLGGSKAGEMELKRCIDLRGKTTIHQCAAIISECKLYAGLDTGLLWFAYIFNRHVVVIQTGLVRPATIKHPSFKLDLLYSDVECALRCAPFEECAYDTKCMKLITPEIVDQKIKAALK